MTPETASDTVGSDIVGVRLLNDCWSPQRLIMGENAHGQFHSTPQTSHDDECSSSQGEIHMSAKPTGRGLRLALPIVDTLAPEIRSRSADRLLTLVSMEIDSTPNSEYLEAAHNSSHVVADYG